MHVESIKLRNFKSFKDVTMLDIPHYCVIVGANGTGKSTLFDVFGFLKDCLTSNVRQALQARGGYAEVVSRGDVGGAPIELEIQFRMEIAGVNRLVTYIVHISQEKNRPVVSREILRYKRGRYGSPFHFLDFERGKGYAVTNEEDFDKPDEALTREYQSVAQDVLAIKGLGQFERFKAASVFRQLIENWYVSDFHINLARGSKDAAGPNEHLSVSGDNLQLVAQNILDSSPDTFERIVEATKRRIPGIEEIVPVSTQDGRLLLRFRDGAFSDPFIDKYVSDGTIKMFACLILLYDPEPHPLLCIEEPENQLYPDLLSELAEEFRSYASQGGQVFVSTHSPDFLNAVALDEVFWLVKSGGYTEIRRARDNEQVAAFMAEGDKMGYLWRQGFFEGADPQ